MNIPSSPDSRYHSPTLYMQQCQSCWYIHWGAHQKLGLYC